MFCLALAVPPLQQTPVRKTRNRKRRFGGSLGNGMRRFVVACGVVYLLLALSLSSIAAAGPSKSTETIPLEQIHAGMKGVCYTVFQGTKPEPMNVEVLGIL